jgi:hypothetical protein
MAYSCDDSETAPHLDLLVDTWDNAYLIFYQNSSGDPAADPHLATNATLASGDCGDPHPAANAAPSSGVDEREQHENVADDGENENGETDDETQSGGSNADNDEQDTLQAVQCMVTSTRHDDWLHRGPFLADLPWQAYMMRVQRVRKPTGTQADYAQLFFFDKHYALSAMYCQEIQYSRQVAIPRVVGSLCPPPEGDDGETHAAYKLMFFSRTRCPGPGACADPMVFRSLLIPNDKPDDLQAAMAKPRFEPSWKTCKCEFEIKAKIAIEKERHAQKIAVLADTTTMKDCSGDLHPAARCAFRLRPHLLKLMAIHFDKHIERMPHGIVELVDLLTRFLCGQSCYHLTEQLHLAEFAALEMKRTNDALDMDILVRKKPFRDEKQGGFINDVDSEDEAAKKKNEPSAFRVSGGCWRKRLL